MRGGPESTLGLEREARTEWLVWIEKRFKEVRAEFENRPRGKRTPTWSEGRGRVVDLWREAWARRLELSDAFATPGESPDGSPGPGKEGKA